MSLKTFKAGAYAPEHKNLTRGQPILQSAVPDLVVLPLQEGPGDAAKPLVKKGDEVKAGQKIAEAEGSWGVPVYASISGQVKAVGAAKLKNGIKGTAITIEGNGSANLLLPFKPLGGEIESIAPEKIVERIREAGIIGMGGAAFPTHVKLTPPEGISIDTVVINGAECEPYLTCDEKAMETMPEEIIKGLQILMTAAQASKGVVGIKGHKEKAIKALEQASSDLPAIEIVPVEDKYPQGAEKMLIDAVLGRRIPKGSLPFKGGVIVNNVQTAIAVKEAVLDGKPLTQRLVTFTGGGLNAPQDYRVYLGTLAEHVINEAGGLKDNAAKVIDGGPMMGAAQHYIDYPIGKSTAGILVLTEKETRWPQERACIRCCRCLDHCPIFLNPTNLSAQSEKGNLDALEKASIMECIECGTCSFICPSRKPLLQRIILGKGSLWEAQQKQ